MLGYRFSLCAPSSGRALPPSIFQGQRLLDGLIQADLPRLLGKRFALVDLPAALLEDARLGRLPAANIVINLVGAVTDLEPDALALAIDRLRRQGYRIAVPDPVAAPAWLPVLGNVDVVVVDAPSLSVSSGLDLSARIVAAAPQASLMVCRVPSLEDFRFCYKLGASLFHGPFITAREDWSERHLEPSTLRVAQVIAALRRGAEVAELARMLKQDAALSVRLLRYINAAANGLQEQVSSIERALTLLGRDRLYRWLALLVCSAEEDGGEPSAALETALVRARFMESLAVSRSRAEQESLFLTGLLSLIDVVLQVPIDRALAPFTLAPEIEEALRDREGPNAPILSLAIACESADPDLIAAAAGVVGMDPAEATKIHLAALGWVIKLQQ